MKTLLAHLSGAGLNVMISFEAIGHKRFSQTAVFALIKKLSSFCARPTARVHQTILSFMRLFLPLC